MVWWLSCLSRYCTTQVRILTIATNACFILMTANFSFHRREIAKIDSTHKKNADSIADTNLLRHQESKGVLYSWKVVLF